ncbi:diguanylate cyclase (GGDEF) domain-containing protein [Nocardioides terrae]|uniref:Diguanylate cyclase (GGDEF) domain-containing protein n=1 Tax=Nocardioides terrae TaxID=574651 RepID=A0A1I1JIA0_9ACTN|nr:EAL domain-containing protein [Nocardioides terrae]SFC47692.1 diguanylate cyclase (GGDEF) domain-containing protein [Nocardioides terrae]
MPRSSLAALLLGVVLLALGPVMVAEELALERQNDAELRHDGIQLASSFNADFERARSLDLLLSRNPDLLSIPQVSHLTSAVNRRANDALRYLEGLYPAAIGEAGLIDDTGSELARVTKGVAAPMEDLSTNEARNPFFRATLDLDPGQVYHAAPYVSAGTGRWVISTSTPVDVGGGHRVVVHFEVALSTFAMTLYAAGSPGREAAVVDARTGRIILQQDGHLPPPAGQFAAFPHWRAADLDSSRNGRTVTVDGRRLALTPVSASSGNANHWVVVNWSHHHVGFVPIWLGVLISAAGACLLLLLIVVVRRQHSTLRRAARLDHLTGLANRKALEEALDRAVAASSHGERVAVVLLDLDSFKQINDTLGHDCGDLVLQEIARRLHANTFEYDTAARLGGDEYAVVLRHLSPDVELTSVGHRLREALIRPIEINGVQRMVGVSIGLAVCPDHGTAPAELLRAADASMYRAKRGREGVSVYEAGTCAGAEESSLAAELLMAIERDEITLVFQPEQAVGSGRIVTVEALARWMRADGTPVPPSTFVPLAEEVGLIRPLTVLTMRKALDEVLGWRRSGLDVAVSVNLSAQLVSDRSVPGLVEELLRERGLTGDALILEITETAAIGSVDVARDVLQDLRALAVRIELDDFGSGYASARTLRDIPLDGVKIDRDLVNDHTPGGRTMLTSMIQLGKVLDLYVVAEGIENESGLDALRSLGADVVQGYHLARPMPPTHIRQTLLEHAAAVDARTGVTR